LPNPQAGAELARLSAPSRLTREAVLYAVATVLASTAWLWPHIIRFREVPDRGDPIFSAWRLARFAHQLLNDPARLFDGNIFYPLPLTLTYSDPTVLQGLLAMPLIAAGVDLLTVANLLFFLAFPACGAAFFFAAWRLTGDPRSALVAGLLGAWYPFHGEHYSHLELQWFMFVPLSIVALMLVLARPTAMRGAALGMAAAAQWLASMYFGLMLFSVLVPCAVIVAVAWRVRPSIALARAMGIAAAIVLPALLFTALPYLASLDTRGERSAQEAAEGSAVPSDYLATHRRMASYFWRTRAANRPERELAPGLSPVALAAFGLSSGVTASKLALAGSGALAFDWSLGFNGLTYPGLYSLFAPYRGIRVPARFAAIVGSILILLGAFGTRRLLNGFRSDRQRQAACAVLAVLVLLDLRLTTSLVKYWPTVPVLYSHVTPQMVLAELPRSHDIDYMYFSTRHWASLVGGYSGFMPRDPALDQMFEEFPSSAAIDAFRRRGATHLTYNCAFELSLVRCHTNLEILRADPSLELVTREKWQGADVSLYRLR
jgi:MFS family permease